MSRKAELINKRLYLVTLDNDNRFVVDVYNDCYETDNNYSIRTPKQTYYLRKEQSYYAGGIYGLCVSDKYIENIKYKIKEKAIEQLELMLSQHIRSCEKISNKIKNIQSNL